MFFLIIRDFFNKLIWDPSFQKKQQFIEILYIHRGVPGDLMRVNFKDVIKIKASSFILKDNETNEEIMIPFHRIEEIIDTQTDDVLYIKKKRGDIENAYKSI